MDVKTRILEGAKDMFLKYAVKAVTMDDIARQLGISKKTIYQFFPNKDELVCEVMKQQMEYQEKEIEDIYNTSADPVEKFLKMTEFIKVIFQGMNTSLLFEIEKYHPNAWKIYLEHKTSCIHNNIVDYIKEGVDSGVFRKELNIEAIAILRMEEVQLGFNPAKFSPAKFNLQEVQVQLLDHFLHGICTLKGHKLINKYKHITEEE